MLKAVDFQILRGLTPHGRVRVPLARQPQYVASLFSESLFHGNQLLTVEGGVRLEDPLHDWSWRQGELRYFARVEGPTDVVVVFTTIDMTGAARFDPMTGQPLTDLEISRLGDASEFPESAGEVAGDTPLQPTTEDLSPSSPA